MTFSVISKTCFILCLFILIAVPNIGLAKKNLDKHLLAQSSSNVNDPTTGGDIRTGAGALRGSDARTGAGSISGSTTVTGPDKRVIKNNTTINSSITPNASTNISGTNTLGTEGTSKSAAAINTMDSTTATTSTTNPTKTTGNVRANTSTGVGGTTSSAKTPDTFGVTETIDAVNSLPELSTVTPSSRTIEDVSGTGTTPP